MSVFTKLMMRTPLANGEALAEFILKNKHSFLLEGRYYFGIGNVFGSSKSDHFGKSNGSSITVTLGYMFRLK